MKKRREAHFTTNNNNKFDNSVSDSDIGILARSNGNTPRFLQENDYDYYCPRETCPTELCDCADGGGSLEDCVDQLQAVCREGKLDQCVFKGYVEMYQDVYCPFASHVLTVVIVRISVTVPFINCIVISYRIVSRMILIRSRSLVVMRMSCWPCVMRPRHVLIGETYKDWTLVSGRELEVLVYLMEGINWVGEVLCWA